MNVTVSKPEHALGFVVMGTAITPIATGPDTVHWELFSLRLTPGARSPLHTVTADKVFTVTTGVVRLTIDDRVEDVHATMIGFVAGPSAQIVFLRGMGALTAHGRPDPTALAEHTARHGVRLITPAPVA